MPAKRRNRWVIGLVLTWLVGTTASAQEGTQDRLDRLESLVQQLQAENASLRSTVDGLQQMADRDAELDDAAIEVRSQVEQLIQARQFVHRGGNLYASDAAGGFVDRLFFTGEWRTRFDVRSNTADLLDQLDDEGLRLDYRFNLGLGFVLTPIKQGEDSPDLRISTRFEIQSVGRGGNNTAENLPSGIGTSVGDFATRENDLDLVRLYQAFILLENILGVDTLDLKVGRQELTYGSQLLLGSNEFYTGTVHDAARLDLDVEFLQGSVSFFYAKEAATDGQSSPTISTGGLLTTQVRASGDEDEMLGLYFSDMKFADPLKIDLYWIYFNARSAGPLIRPDNVTSPTDPAIDAFGRNLLGGQFHTLGTWLRADVTDAIWLSVEVAYQTGDDEQSDNIGAFAVDFSAEWRVPFLEDVNGRLYAGYYFAEGPDNDADNGFSPLFISRHNVDPLRGNHGAYSRLGNLDLIPTQNIHVFQAGLKFEPWARWELGLTYLYSWFNHSREALSSNVLGNVFVDERSFGHEVDLFARHRISNQADIFFNFSVFLPDADFIIQSATDSTSFLPYDSDVAVAGYVQIQVRF